jgi:hypothetical protein
MPSLCALAISTARNVQFCIDAKLDGTSRGDFFHTNLAY